MSSKFSSIVLRELQEQNRLFTFIFNYYINIIILIYKLLIHQ